MQSKIISGKIKTPEKQKQKQLHQQLGEFADWMKQDKNASEILNQIFMAESAILRAEKHFSADSVEAAMAQLNLYKATEAIITAAKEGIVSFAEGDEQRMMLMGLRRFTKYTNMPNIVALRETITTKVVAENQYCF